MDTKPSFTPGPWTYEADPPKYARVRSGSNRFILAIVGNNAIAGEESSANAALIAAAPDLYEALADCIVSLCAAGREHVPSFARARAALAKAEGR